MLEPILQGLRDVDGVQGALIVDAAAAVVAYNAHAIYDTGMLQQVARAVTNSIDSVQLVQDDWDMLNAHFGDGQLVLRSLRTAGDKPRRYVLAVIADATLNVAFLGVALRVAAGKLVAELESAASAAGSGSQIPVAIAGGTGRFPKVELPRSESDGRGIPSAGNTGEWSRPIDSRPIARSGLTWSGDTNSGIIPAYGSQTSGPIAGGSEVHVTDAASTSFLAGATKALAASVGPMAKVFVKEAVREVCGDRPFSRAEGAILLAHLAALIDDPDDRAAFQRATRGL